MRLISFSDDDNVLSGKREPAYPDSRDRHPSSYESAALHLVKTEIDKAIENPQCPRCRSVHIKDRSAPGPKGATWRLTECQDCGLAYDIELDA